MIVFRVLETGDIQSWQFDQIHAGVGELNGGIVLQKGTRG